MTVAIFRNPNGLKHDVDPDHPECPDRLSAIDDQLLMSGLDMVLAHKTAQPATLEQIRLAHDNDYIEGIFERAPTHGVAWLDEDTAMTEHTLPAALEAAGAGCQAVDWVMDDTNRRAFCAVRPPGHHATRDAAMGFCIFNNIAIAARYAVKTYGLSRVAIVDFDVHHGNGSENILADDPNIALFSSFQHPFYPFSGDRPQALNIHTAPLDAQCDGATYREQVKPWLAQLEMFAPQLILISAGFDGHAEDDMADVNLVEDDYAWLTSQLRVLAEKHCSGRIVSMLEGGYNLSALARSVVAHLKALQVVNAAAK